MCECLEYECFFFSFFFGARERERDERDGRLTCCGSNFLSKQTICTFVIERLGDISSLQSLHRWLASILGDDILRLKGEVAVNGYDCRVLVQAVNDMFDTYETTPWPQDSDRRTSLVIIGRYIDQDALYKSFIGVCCS